MSSDQRERIQIEMEYAYVDWHGACRDMAMAVTGDLEDTRHCRRAIRHEGLCASGYGAAMSRWQRLGDRA